MNDKYYVWLVKCLGVANNKSNIILKEYNDIVEFYKDCKNKSIKLSVDLDKYELSNLYNIDINNIDEIYNAYKPFRVKVVTINDSRYPKLLREIKNPPIVLFMVGDISTINDDLLVTVVGTRRESSYGKKACEVICSELSEVGFSIVSGLANGGDTTAHITALKHNAKTYGFLACGLDVKYPSGKSKLKNAIAKQGAIITEFLPQTPAHPNNFHIRNRLMAGISLGTLVIEAPSRSGTLITAHCAVEQGRDVFAVPSGIFWSNGIGVNSLIKEGAKPVRNAMDIIEEYFSVYPEKIKVKENNIDYVNISETDNKFENDKNTNIIVENNKANLTYENAVKDIPDLLKDATAKKLYEIIALSSYNAEELSVIAELPLNELLISITRLEMFGIIKIDIDDKIKIVNN